MSVVTDQFRATQIDRILDAAAPAVSKPEPRSDVPTIWGLTPVAIHDYFWESRGIRVVRAGDTDNVMARTELYLLTGRNLLTTFRIQPLINNLFWTKLDVLYLRVKNAVKEDYKEVVVSCPGSEDSIEEFVRFNRLYGAGVRTPERIAVTRDRELADRWRHAADDYDAWKTLRKMVSRRRRGAHTVFGQIYDRASLADQQDMISDLVSSWGDAGEALPRVQRPSEGVWAHDDATIPKDLHVVGNVWVGACRTIEPGEQVLGPAVLWDQHRPEVPRLLWDDFDPGAYDNQRRTANFEDQNSNAVSAQFAALIKRSFDIVFAALAILLTLPAYPLVMAAIYIESGRPFFFGHRRETTRGRSFRCWKFRSMRQDAEAIKNRLSLANLADGPQFFIEDDPRLTRVGRFLRQYNIDEFPQFWNVLMGDMSVVGPRPSPHSENQYCPTWREARLRVRPGITGLWQVMRTRQSGNDFQEWIKYDLMYVHKHGLLMDLRILIRTIRIFLRLSK